MSSPKGNKWIPWALAVFFAACFFALLGLVLTEHTAGLDDPVRFFLYSLRTEALTGFLIVLTNFANKYVIIGICLLLLILPWTRLSLGLPLSAGALATTILNHLIKGLVCRERPDFLHLVEEGGYSFPSGHSISSMFFYGMAIWLIWHFVQRLDRPRPAYASRLPLYEKRTACILTVLLCIPMVLVGVSRVYLGVHFPTDVLGGWSLALLSIIIEAQILLGLERRRMSPSPLPDQKSTAPGSRSK